MRRPARERRRGSCSTRRTSTWPPACGTRRRRARGWRTRCSATRPSSARTTPSGWPSTRSTTAATASRSIRIRSARSVTSPSPTRAIRTATGTRCGTCAPDASRAAGRSRWRFPSSRCVTGRGRRPSGESSFAAWCAGRTNAPTSPGTHLGRPARPLPRIRRRHARRAWRCPTRATSSKSSRTPSAGPRPTSTSFPRRRGTATAAWTSSTASPRT